MDMNSTDANTIFLPYEEDTLLSKDQYAGLKESLNTMSLVVYSLNFVFGVIGNGVVIWVTGFKMKKTVNTVWFLNLAVADFLFTAFLPLSVTYLALNFHWPFGNFMCKLNSASSYLNMYASVYFLVVISLDRCVSVVWPVWAQNHRSVRKASQVSLIVWIMALILSIPYFVFRDTDDPFNDGRIICYNNYLVSGKHNPLSSFRLIKLRYWATSITRFLLGFVVPFTIIVSCYAVLIKHVRRNRTLASKSGRMFKIIIAVIVAFFVCWVPLHIMLLIEMVYRTTTTDHNLEYFITIGIPLTTSLAFTNSCLNPLLYVFIGQDFKNTVRKSLLKIMETAFQEDSGTDQKTVSTSDNQDRSTQNTGV